MLSTLDLWLPILLSGVFVFIASSLLHMVIPIHKGDYVKLPGEERVLEALRAQGVRPGQYMFPCAPSMKDMGTPEMLQKMRTGPVGTMVIQASGPMNLGKNLAQWFVYCLVIGALVAYLAAIAMQRGAPGADVFRFVGAAAILGYALSSVTESIWKGVSWTVTAKFVFDGVIYGLITGATFAWLWPAAV